jgi:hypothetical protein
MLIGQIPVIVYLALLALVVLLIVRHRGLMRGRTRLVAGPVWCPVKDRVLSAELEEEVWDGRRVDVARCAAFSPETAVTCGKACLRITERPRPATASRVPMMF